MGVDASIKCGISGTRALVNKNNQLVTGDIEFSKFYTAQNASDNVAVNVVAPKAGKNFVITAIILSGDRAIAANGAVTDIFENDTGPTDGTVNKQVITEEIAKQTRMVATGLNIKVTEGRWINMKADDTVVRVNIAGYYIDANGSTLNGD
jgi:hypothetical protein